MNTRMELTMDTKPTKIISNFNVMIERNGEVPRVTMNTAC